MISNKLSMTAQIPSGFALPTFGHASEATVRGTDFGGMTVGTGTPVVIRERQVAPITGGKGLAPAYVLGTTAWSPPTS